MRLELVDKQGAIEGILEQRVRWQPDRRRFVGCLAMGQPSEREQADARD
jgi:hypothetical protein